MDEEAPKLRGHAVAGRLPARNDWPEFVPYEYNGLGYDQLTGYKPRTPAELAEHTRRSVEGKARARARREADAQPPPPLEDGRCAECGYRLESRGHRNASHKGVDMGQPRV